ncbi:MAG: serine/threonine protein kinase [Myxococcales bacterium]|nr:serine/threonine protein kinase [Myxococcales bacterium]
MADDEVLVCRRCGQGWQGATVGSRCPAGDGAALVPLDVHQAHPQDPLLGHVIAGRYPVVGVLGSGGFGSVYRAIQEPVGRAVALKIIAADVDDTQLVARFEHEAQAVARLSDPSIVTLHDYGADSDGSLYMVFEYIAGHTLEQVLEAERRLDAARAVGVVTQILGGLAEAHGMGLVHRDLKPGNVMLTTTRLGEEKAKILDFGIAKVVGGGTDGVHTREGIVLGTPRYMSPEQCRDADLDGRSDLYSLGVVLFEMLAGHPPIDGPTPLDILMAHLESPPTPLPTDVPAPVAACVMRALSKRPEDRFPDAAAMAGALRAALSGQMPASPAVRVSAPARRAPVASAVPRAAPVVTRDVGSGDERAAGRAAARGLEGAHLGGAGCASRGGGAGGVVVVAARSDAGAATAGRRAGHRDGRLGPASGAGRRDRAGAEGGAGRRARGVARGAGRRARPGRAARAGSAGAGASVGGGSPRRIGARRRAAATWCARRRRRARRRWPRASRCRSGRRRSSSAARTRRSSRRRSRAAYPCSRAAWPARPCARRPRPAPSAPPAAARPRARAPARAP